MTSAHRIRTKIGDCRDVLDAIERRAILADAQARSPSQRRDQLGTVVTGNTSSDPESFRTWSDRTGDTAVAILDTLSQVDVSLADVKEALYAVAKTLGDWAEQRVWDDDIRRCTVDQCAGKHHARGYCEKHYRRAIRAEQAEQVRRQIARSQTVERHLKPGDSWT